MNFTLLFPYLGVAVLALALLLTDLFRRVQTPMMFTFAAVLYASICLIVQLGGILGAAPVAPDAALYEDGFGALFSLIILVGTLLTSMLHHNQLAGQRVEPTADVDVMLMFAALGGMVMVSAANLITFFVAFELLSVSVYAMAGLARREKASSEGAMKYFILGAFSSAFLLYGIALVYGATGSFQLAEIGARGTVGNPMFSVGLGLMLFGLFFKISAAPFHFWSPDVYQGAPTSITGFMATVVKTAAFGSFLRMMCVAFGSIAAVWTGFVWMIAVLTMTVGNLMALRQRSLKRMLAYSSISHAGYALMGFVALRGQGGAEAVAFYLLVYTFMTIAAFGAIMLVTSNTAAQYANDDIDSFRGLGWAHPVLGLAMTLAMLSLAGFPPLAGFFGKFYLFSAAIRAGYTGLAIIAALNSLVSLAYYLRLVVVMYFSGEREFSLEIYSSQSFCTRMALTAATAVTVLLGLFSNDCVRWIQVAMHGVSL